MSDRLTATFKGLRGKGRLTEADVDTTVREIRRALLEADVALPVVRAFTGSIRERALSAEVSQALNPAQQIVKIVNEELIGVLGGQTRRLRFAKNPPTVIMLAGLQGAGKTTLAGKLGKHLKDTGHTPLLVACDLQRPNAVTQLQVVGQRAGVEVFAPEPGNGVGNPVEVARRGVEHARDKQYDVVVVDTAGRLGVDAEMMQQASDIREATQPDEVLFVVDAMIGQDALAVAQAFQEGVDLTGVVLTKLDGDARGGAALSVATTTGRPVLFASTGEGLADFEVFHPDRMASRILDMGDVLTLIEQAERAFDAKESAALASRFEAGEDFTLEDFLTQMQALKKMGPLNKVLGMLPGMGAMKDQLDELASDGAMKRIEAIVRSMTPLERHNSKVLNGSRRARIARGSGVEVSEVNQLIDRFTEAQKVMRAMRAKGGGGLAGALGGMGGGPGGGMAGLAGGKKSRGRMQAPPAKGKKAKSGNPAKRAEQERAASEKALASRGSAFGPGAAFGAGASTGDEPQLPPGFELPSGFDKHLGR
nr:signal recognition particle protein [Quadrisphaera sp. RL12-1S]